MPLPITPPNDDVKVELVVNEKAEAFVFHNKPFRKKLSWFEFDLDGNRLEFIMNDGDIRNFGLPVDPKLTKYLQNAFQVLVVHVDEKTGEELESAPFPLIVHRA